jgi:adenylate cyclase
MARGRVAARALALAAFGVWASVRLAPAQCPDGTPPPCGRPAAPARAPNPHGVAVLYFADLSRDSAAAPIAEGLTEEIIARLSQVAGLRVPSRYATIRYRGRRVADPRQVGRELGMRYVLDGTLRRAGQRLHIVLTMTDATNGLNVWGHSYERPLGEIFTIQDSVAIQVAERVLGQLTAGDRGRLSPAAATASLDAYQAYLRGVAAVRSRTASAASVAVAQYRQAIALDPRFGRAWAGLSQALALAVGWGWSVAGVADDSIAALALQAAQHALELDSTSSAAWLATAMAERDRDRVRALAFHQRAVELDSGSVEALHQLAWGYLGLGDLDTAMAIERQVIARDPYYAYAYAGLAHMLNAAGRPAEALAVATQGVAIDSTHAPLYWQLADAQLQLGDAAAARRAVDRAQQLGFDVLGVRILQALTSLAAGGTALVQRDLPDLDRAMEVDLRRARGGLGYASVVLLSGLYGRLGDVDGSLRWAARVAESPRRFYAVFFTRHWMWAPVRSDPRFQRFVAALRE